MTWSVVLELPKQEPILMGRTRRLEDAQAEAVRLAGVFRGTGGKVTISQPDSADQLQPYSKDRYHRQEPEKPAVGEDATVIVPTARRRKKR